jgi:hypothetical protein
VGVAPNKTLAKIASDRNKPNGQCVVAATRDEVMDFIQELPIRKVCGWVVGWLGGEGGWARRVLPGLLPVAQHTSLRPRLWLWHASHQPNPCHPAHIMAAPATATTTATTAPTAAGDWQGDGAGAGGAGRCHVR